MMSGVLFLEEQVEPMLMSGVVVLVEQVEPMLMIGVDLKPT